MWYCEPGTPVDRQRAKYDIKGEGFVWSHSTMDSLAAMDLIEMLFLTVKDSTWLPQWSFDFWIIPYLVGRGIRTGQFREFMIQAQKLLAMEIAYVPEREKSTLQQEYLLSMVRLASEWPRSS
jgi:p-methyltransferase